MGYPGHVAVNVTNNISWSETHIRKSFLSMENYTDSRDRLENFSFSYDACFGTGEYCNRSDSYEMESIPSRDGLVRIVKDVINYWFSRNRQSSNAKIGKDDIEHSLFSSYFPSLPGGCGVRMYVLGESSENKVHWIIALPWDIWCENVIIAVHQMTGLIILHIFAAASALTAGCIALPAS